MRSLPLILVPVVLIALAGCVQQPAQILGNGSAFGAVTSIRDLKSSAAPVTIQGTMIEKCPVAGCWFKVQDPTGVLKVDTKTAGFVVVDVPVGSRVTVSGRLQAAPERQISALGVRY